MSWIPGDPNKPKDNKDNAEAILYSQEMIKENKNKIAKGISNVFLNKIIELQNKPEHMAIIEQFKKRAQEPIKQKVEEGYKKRKGKPALIKAQGLKIYKGKPVKDETDKPIFDKNNKEIIFDFSILFDESGNVIALDEETIGRGMLGQGRPAADLNDLSRDIFVKVYRTFEGPDFPNTEQFNKRGGPYKKPNEKRLQREVRKHKINNSFRGFVATKNKAYLVQERAMGIELFDYCVALDNKISQTKRVEHDVSLKLLQAAIASCEAIQKLHDQNIIHRDIKPENIVYDETTKTAKLIDIETLVYFNTAKTYDREKKQGKESLYSGVKKIEGRDVFFAPIEKGIGTPAYIAPEIVKTIGKTNEITIDPTSWKGEYSKASDRFAFGKSLGLLFTRPLHYYLKSNVNLDEPTKKLLEEIKNIITELTNPNPKERPELNTVLKRLKEQEKQLIEMIEKSSKKVIVDKVPETPSNDIDRNFSI